MSKMNFGNFSCIIWNSLKNLENVLLQSVFIKENHCNNYENSEYKCNVDDKHPEAIAIADQNIQQYTASYLLQFYLLTQRSTRNNLRLKLTSYVKIISALITAIIILLIFGYLKKDDQSVMNRIGIIFLMVMQFIFNPVQGGIHIFPDETPVFMREYTNGMYSSIIYFICRSMNDIPGIIVFNTILTVIVYFACGLNIESADRFFVFYFYSFLLSWMCLGIGLIPGAMFRNKDIASAFIPIVLIPMMLVSGFFVSLSNDVVILYPLEYISPFKYGFAVFMHNEFRGLKLDCVKYCDPIGSAGIKDSEAVSVICTFFAGVLYYIIAYLVLMIRTKTQA